jgi:DNA-binding NarL/FixJ family response regulator
MAELVECAGELAVQGCGAEAAAIGRVSDGVSVPWLRSGHLALLDPDEPGHTLVADARTLERQVISSGRTAVCEMGDGQVAVAAIATNEVIVGVLQVVARDLSVGIVESYAQALGSMFGLVSMHRRAEELRYALARLRNSLADSGERPIELYDAVSDSRGSRPNIPATRVSSSALRARLSARQREVLDLMMAGLSNAEMAERLVVALPTVKSHVRAVLRASGAVNRSDAVARFSRGDVGG